MNGRSEDRCILEWDESGVHAWLSSLGYSQYETQIREHNISGDILCMLDLEGLKDIGIISVGQRLTILKSVYHLKLAQNIPIDPEQYTPPSERHDPSQQHVSLRKMLTDQNKRLRVLENENKHLKESLQFLLEEFNHFRLGRSVESQLPGEPPFKELGTSYVKPENKFDNDVPRHSSQQIKYGTPNHGHPDTHASSSISQQGVTDSLTTPSQDLSKSRSQDDIAIPKRFKVRLDDPTWKILPAALKKFRINDDHWSNYAMYICYGSADDRRVRRLNDNEKPLLLFQKLKDARKNPMCLVKNITKPMRSWHRLGKLQSLAPVVEAVEENLGG